MAPPSTKLQCSPLQTPSPSPKRKRNPNPHSPTESPSSSPVRERIRVDTNTKTAGADLDEGIAGSPRTKVAQNLQRMQIKDSLVSRVDLQQPASSPQFGGSGADRVLFEEESGDNETMVRKRVKVLPVGITEIPQTPEVHTTTSSAEAKEGKAATIDFESPVMQDCNAIGKPSKVTLGVDAQYVLFKSGGSKEKLKGSELRRAYPSINQIPSLKTTGKMRAGTPPLTPSTVSKLDSEEGSPVHDPERAALTWQDTEITGHNPSDPEDDGEGINGIGFKPTPAEACARAQKRQLQMKEYRNREAREAREARVIRSQRRRQGDKSGREVKKVQQRQVRFLDVEKNSDTSNG